MVASHDDKEDLLTMITAETLLLWICWFVARKFRFY